MNDASIRIELGIPESHRFRAAELIDEAFRSKLSGAIPDDVARSTVLANGLVLSAAIGAFENDALVGIIGLQTTTESIFDGITFRMLREELGFGSIRAAFLLHLLDRSTEEHTIRIELIAVDASLRGRGVGTLLLDAVNDYACAQGFATIELDVVDTNPDAHRLYLRQGFVDVRTERLPIPASWLGFQEATVMSKCPTCHSDI